MEECYGNVRIPCLPTVPLFAFLLEIQDTPLRLLES